MSVEGFLRGLDPDASVRLVETAPATPEAFFDLCDRQPETPCKLVVHRASDGQRVGHFVDQISDARIFVDLDRGRVDKRVTAFVRFDVVAREARWLRALAASGRVPALLDVSDTRIATAYAGEPLRQHNLPADWRGQARDILAALAAVGCSHNDIKCDNLVVLDGRMRLIDFGFAAPAGAPIPPHWPKQLGRQHRLAVHVFDDAHAIEEACREAEAGRVSLSRRVMG